MDDPVMMNCMVPMGEEFLSVGWGAVVAAFLGTAVFAYFLGCSNGAVIISKYILRDDVRNHGSGNAGQTNFNRTFRGPLTLAVILIDVLKAVIAILLSMWIVGSLYDFGGHRAELIVLAKYWAGSFCLLGHIFPCMFGFKAGKGVLSGGTIAIMLDWRLALLVWGGFLILALLTRYVSLGSVFAAAAFPIGTWLFVSHDPVVMTLAVLLGALVLWMHRGNIKRLLKGEENKLSFHKKKE